MRLVDSHCHIQSERFDADRDEVIDAARHAGVERILVPGWDLASSAAALQLVDGQRWLDAAVGIHPHEAGRAAADDRGRIERWAEDERVVAIGETGLDFDREFSSRAEQLANVRWQLELGLALGKPVILHCRSGVGSMEAHDALIESLEAVGITSGRRWPRPPAVIHSFSGTLGFAREALERGLAVSISGLAFRAGEESTFGAVVGIVPEQRLLTETDAPFLPPPGAPRRRNEPRWVAVTAARVAEARAGASGGDATADAVGDRLVAAYDATFRRARA